MLKINKVFIITCFLFVQFSLFAQNNTNSPYTRYGYGELGNKSFGAGRAMGGIGYGLRSSKQINPMNPASYSAIDTMTFLFDFGVYGQLSWFDDGTNKQKNKNGNVEYIALQFPITNRLAMSAGILPFSYVGYDFNHVETVEGETFVNNFTGKGGLNDIYAGLSMDIWKKRLSVGANVGYLFGSVTHSSLLSFPSSTSALGIEKKQEIKVNDLKLDLGIQYTHPLSKTEQMTFGLAYTPSNKLNTKVYNSVLEGSVLTIDTLSNSVFDIPASYGFGLSYVKQNKLTAGLDFLYEEWDKATFGDETDLFNNRYRVAGGIEFIPGYMERSFFKRIRYRAGVHYGNSYQKVNANTLGTNDNGYDDYGASIGFGLPLIDNRSFLNLSFEYMRIKPQARSMIDEQYFKITVNYTFNEQWFYKFKLK
ncbi:hypothetical protein [Massilibacteroides sp.]|uniref:hypothetical protein n=1 Tax=Massilibacteroides sp. TaxID=2034766 RepID=UPI0026342224|nr:hypothetical protein [Massilibacteroides sp.]MDD4514135.1 hypothetical protein [Massilibacteroides sp.]